MRPKILITNDDGILSKGIFALWEAMEEVGETYVVAPSSEKSASSHSITLSEPLRVKFLEQKNGFKGWSISGTPVDCVKIAIKTIMKEAPDLLISGINRGANLGTNIIYSGTVSAASEGTMLGIPSIAISLASFENNNYESAIIYAKKIIMHVLNHGLPVDTLLNVNIPNCDYHKINGIKITKQGGQRFIDEYEERTDPRNGSYYWIKGQMKNDDNSIDFDGKAIKENFVSITPINYKLTNELYLKNLKDLFSSESSS